MQKNTSKSKNKPSKQKRDAAKRRMTKEQEKRGNKEHERGEESIALDKVQQVCQHNIVPAIDKYEVCNSKD